MEKNQEYKALLWEESKGIDDSTLDPLMELIESVCRYTISKQDEILRDHLTE